MASHDTARMLDAIALDRELAARSFYHYLEMSFPVIEPGVRFMSNWHIGAIAEHVEAVFANQIKNLVINVPPGSMKSLSICTQYPTWAWGPANHPGRRMIFGSYAEDLSNRDSLRSRMLIESDWYQQRWGEGAAEPEWRRVVRNPRQWAKRRFDNLAGGIRMATTPAGRVTGFHGHDLVVDDPTKPAECTNLALTQVEDWWFKTMPSRKLPDAHAIIIMQRLHDRDLAGLCIERGYDCLIIPMEYEREVRTRTPLKWKDPRTKEGEPLWPERWPGTDLPELKEALGPRETAAQLQQRPAPAEGAIFKDPMFKFYKIAPSVRRMSVILSVDANFKKTDNGSFAVGQAWGQIASDCYLLDQVRGRWSFSELLEAIRRLAERWPTAYRILVEDKANGSALVDVLGKELSGVTTVLPEKDKVRRAHAVEPMWAAGNVWTPDPSVAPWVKDYVLELKSFPVGKNDDQVDTMTQALAHLKHRNMSKFLQAMKNVRGGR